MACCVVWWYSVLCGVVCIVYCITLSGVLFGDLCSVVYFVEWCVVCGMGSV